MKIWVLIIMADGYPYVSTFDSQDRAKASLAAWSRKRWKGDRLEEPAPDDDVKAIKAWFHHEPEDSWDILETTLNQG